MRGGRHDGASPHAGLLPRTRLVGRDRDIADVELLLDDPSVDVVVLQGEAGVGKSRLAQEVVDRRQRRSDAVVGLERTDARDAPRRLVLLDNVHEFGLAERDRIVESARAPGETILLVTDRRGLSGQGTRQHAVRPLSIPEDYSALDIEAFCQVPSVELFVVILRLGQPSFSVDVANQGRVARLCAQLRGIPLHLQLAGRLLGAVDVSMVNVREATRSSALVTLLERDIAEDPLVQFESLTAEERLVIGTATVFADGFGLDALAAVVGIDGVRLAELTEGLRNKNLLVCAAHTSEGVSGFVGVRCHVPITALPLARAIITRDRLDLKAAAHAHGAYYLRLLGYGLAAIEGRAQKFGLTLLQVEWANIATALVQLRTGPDPHRAVDAVRGLRRYWRAFGLVFDLQDQLESLTEREDALDPGSRRRLNVALADAEARLGERELAAESLRRATVAAADLPPDEAAELGAAKAVLELIEDDPDAGELLAQAAEVIRAAGRAAEADAAILLLAMHVMLDRRPSAAAGLCEAVLAAARRRGDQLTSAAALFRLCVCHAALHDEERAGEYYARGLSHIRDLGLAVALGQLAEILGSCMVRDTTDRALNVTELLGAMSHVRPEISAGPEEPIFVVGQHEERMRRVLGLDKFTGALIRGRNQTPFALLVLFADRARAEPKVATPNLPIADESSLSMATITSMVLSPNNDAWSRLTPRESEVALLVAEGLTNSQIGHRLQISEWTVVNHMRAVLKKLECRSRIDVARRVAERDLARSGRNANSVVIEPVVH